MSFPLSTLLAKLYSVFPTVQWFSLCMVSTLILISIVYAFYIVRIKNASLKFLLFVLGLIYLRFLVTNVSVTTLTITIIALAIPLIKNHHRLFWFFIVAASLFRFNIVLGLAPIMLIPYLIFFRKENFGKKELPVLFILWSLLIMNLMWNKFYDQAYQNWLEFRNSHQYFIDFHGRGNLENLTESEKHLLRTWVIQDEDLLPSKKVIEAAGNKYIILFDNLMHISIRKVTSIVYHNKIISLLLFFSILLFLEREVSWRKKFLLFFFIISFIALLLVRNVERVTIPTSLIWFIMLSMLFLERRKLNRLKLLFASGIVVFCIDLPIYNTIHSEKHLAWAREKNNLMQEKNFMYETAIYFPTDYTPEYLWSTILQNRLFDEDHWFIKNILPADWVSCHPLFYKLHDISHDEVQRRYKNYHEYLLSPDTAFIGGKKLNESITPIILSEYDKKFLKNTNCHHTVKIVKESEHFGISQIVVVCTDNRSKR
ncbi:hypothetical protein [Hydrogenimonas cancrithermarum]|uniref:hypothetical protein n=1 Tax=Hydrogenimonas cancrithermarum TaxID=2993563 RepID=UPI0025736D34|nr:hypothetical protein [Hydrogenimonas cancrithermarum]